MTNKTHVTLGLLTSLIILHNNPQLDAYTIITGVSIGSLIPDLDTKKSDPSQLFPLISSMVVKLTKHREFTHMILPFIFIIFYYYFDSEVCLWFGIGALTHASLDFGTKIMGITCDSNGEKTLYTLFWIGIVYTIGDILFNKYNLIKYISNDSLMYIKKKL